MPKRLEFQNPGAPCVWSPCCLIGAVFFLFFDFAAGDYSRTSQATVVNLTPAEAKQRTDEPSCAAEAKARGVREQNQSLLFALSNALQDYTEDGGFFWRVLRVCNFETNRGTSHNLKLSKPINNCHESTETDHTTSKKTAKATTKLFKKPKTRRKKQTKEERQSQQNKKR